MISKQRMDEINAKTVDRSAMFYWQADRPMTMAECAEIFGNRHDIDEEALRHTINEVLKNSGGNYAKNTVVDIVGDDNFMSGSVNINRLITLDDGTELVVRAHPKGLRNGYFDVEAAAIRKAASVVPAPAVIAVSHHAEAGGFDMIIFSKMPGKNPHVTAGQGTDAELAREMGLHMAKIHQIEVTGFGFFNNALAAKTGALHGIHTNFRDHVLASLDQNAQDITEAGYITPAQSTAITNLIRTSTLLDCTSPRLLHNDIADWNILADNGKITAVLDWDECFAGDPVADIAGWSLFFKPERLELFLEGYRSVTPTSDDFEAKLHLYRLRYTICKMALRHKKFQYTKSEQQAELLRVGKQAIIDELAYFNLS